MKNIYLNKLLRIYLNIKKNISSTSGIVQERLRYVPLGWAKYYEFNESDLRVACDTLDTWIDATAMV